MTFVSPEAALCFLAEYEPPVSNSCISWVLTGGLACQLHMRAHNAETWYRHTKDLDLYTFSDHLGHIPLSCWEVVTIIDGQLQPLPPFGPFRAPDIFLDVWHGFHCDNIVPTPADVCEMEFSGILIPVLRPEFLFIFKTLCCFFRRPRDIFDAAGLLQVPPFETQYFSNIIARSPFANILPTRTQPEDLCNTIFRQQMATRLLSAKLDVKQEELFSKLPADMVFPLIMTDQEKNAELEVSLLQSCIKERRINQLSETEQAFALLLACWSEPEPTMRRLMETQELLSEAVFLQESCFNIHTYFAFAARWGRYMQPLMHTDYAPKLQAGFLQSNMRNALMTQSGALRGATPSPALMAHQENEISRQHRPKQ